MSRRMQVLAAGAAALLLAFTTGCYTQLAPPVEEETVVVTERAPEPEEPEVVYEEYEEEGEGDVTNVYIYGGYPVYHYFYTYDPYWYDPFYDPFWDPIWAVRFYRPWRPGFYVSIGFYDPFFDPFVWYGPPYYFWRSRYYYDPFYRGFYTGFYYGSTWGGYYPPEAVREFKKRPFGRRGRERFDDFDAGGAGAMATGARRGSSGTIRHNAPSSSATAAAKGRRTRKGPTEISRRDSGAEKATVRTRSSTPTRRGTAVRRRKSSSGSSKIVAPHRSSSTSKANRGRRVVRRRSSSRSSSATVKRSTSRRKATVSRRTRSSSSRSTSTHRTTVSRSSSSSSSKATKSSSSSKSSRRKRK